MSNRKIILGLCAMFAIGTLNIGNVREIKAAQENASWFQKIEAESGILKGEAAIETPNNLGGDVTLVSYIDNGETAEQNSVTLAVNADFSDDVEMVVHYRCDDSGRKLAYRVNDGEEYILEDLNSGGWNQLADTEPVTISIEQGNNTIRMYAPVNSYGPGIDYITLSRNGGNEENTEQVAITFLANGSQQGETLVKNLSDTIEISDLPETPEIEGKDFLGWYWGNNNKYEGTFPMNLSDIPENIRNTWNGTLIFNARFGNNIPANPVEKEGYRLIFQEEFDGNELDSTNWVDRYLSSWSQDYTNTQQWTVENGIMNIQILESTMPWCPEFDGQTVVTGFTTGQRNGLHNWNKTNQVRNPEDTQLTHINQYGYYEMRAKGQSGSSRHIAWWLTGFQDTPDESAEIDIFEVLGNNNHQVPPALHKWNDSDAFVEGLPSYTNNQKDFNNEYHVYGFDWQEGTGSSKQYPDKIIFYVDGVKTAEKDVNIDYPMIQLLSLYEKRAGGWTGNWEWMPYPNSYEIDYVRVYKKLPEGQAALPEDQLRVENITAEDITVAEGEAELVTYDETHGGPYTEKNLAGTKSYVTVLWNDGVKTQEPVVWDPITQDDLDRLNRGESIQKTGSVPSVNGEATMTINVEGAPMYSAK